MSKQNRRLNISLPDYLDPELQVEITDLKNQPLIHMPWSQAQKQKLPCRLMVLLLRNIKKSLFLKDKSTQGKKSSPLFGLIFVPIKAGESHEEWATYLARNETGLKNLKSIKLTHEFFFESYNAFLSLYAVELPGKLPPLYEDGKKTLIVDQDELKGLIKSVPESISPELSWLSEKGYLFP